MEKEQIYIFCDFDGTVARADVGYQLFHHFSNGKNDDLLPDWKAGKIGNREILIEEAKLVQATEDEMIDFISKFELDVGFGSFVRLCRSNDIEPIILSEGMTFYINKILNQNNISKLLVYSNVGTFHDRTLSISFPHENKNCIRCGSCKGERIDEIANNSNKSSFVVFVGDGYSDVCAINKTSLLFAKKDLASYCQAERIEYTAFNDFFDVSRKLIDMGILDKEVKV